MKIIGMVGNAYKAGEADHVDCTDQASFLVHVIIIVSTFDFVWLFLIDW